MKYLDAAILAFLVGGLGVAGWLVYDWGYGAAMSDVRAETAALEARLDELADEARREEVKRLHAERQRDELMERLDAEAVADPDAGSPGLSSDSLLRLDTIR